MDTSRGVLQLVPWRRRGRALQVRVGGCAGVSKPRRHPDRAQGLPARGARRRRHALPRAHVVGPRLLDAVREVLGGDEGHQWAFRSGASGCSNRTLHARHGTHDERTRHREARRDRLHRGRRTSGYGERHQRPAATVDEVRHADRRGRGFLHAALLSDCDRHHERGPDCSSLDRTGRGRSGRRFR